MSATHCLHAVGCAEAGIVYSRVTEIEGRESKYSPDEITYISIGEGGTSEGEFWESLNTAATKQLPILYLVEDNGYAISVPVDVQTPTRRHLARARAASPAFARCAATGPTIWPVTGRCARLLSTCATGKVPPSFTPR